MKKELTLNELGQLIADYKGVKNFTMNEVENNDFFIEFMNNETGYVDVFSLVPVDDKDYIEYFVYPNPIRLQGVQGERYCALYTYYIKKESKKATLEPKLDNRTVEEKLKSIRTKKELIEYATTELFPQGEVHDYLLTIDLKLNRIQELRSDILSFYDAENN